MVIFHSYVSLPEGNQLYERFIGSDRPHQWLKKKLRSSTLRDPDNNTNTDEEIRTQQTHAERSDWSVGKFRGNLFGDENNDFL